jgi:hypothetical protein
MKKKSITIIIALLAAVLASFGGSAAGAGYRHIWVDQARGVNSPETPGTPEEPFKSITYALARADYLGWPEPWHIHIGPGVYDADPVIKPAFERELFPISLREGMIFEGSDPCNCIIDGQHLTQGFVPILYGSDLTDVKIRGLTLRNMNHNGNGGAVELLNCAGRIENCIIQNCSAQSGGGLYLLPHESVSSFGILGCSFTNNSASSGGGFCVNGSLTGSITGCSFTNNSSGGFCVNGSLTGSITSCNFTNNSTGCWGGGFYVAGSLNGSITSCSFTNNSAGNGGGGFLVGGSLNGSITGCSFTNNSGAGGAGGGFYINSLNGSITGCSFTNNSASNGGGFFVGSLTGSITDCSFTNNSASSGGGFCVNGSLTGSITDCSFKNNSASNGGGFRVDYSLNGSITGCRFVDNSGGTGEAVYVRGGKISNCIFSGHNVNAVKVEWADYLPPTKIHSCLFIAPQELGDVLGWAVKAHQETIILNNTMIGPGGAPQALASAIYIESSAQPQLGMIYSNIIVDTKRAIQIVPSAGDMPIKYNQFDNVADIVCQGEQGMGNDLWWLEWNLNKFRNNKYDSPLFVGGDPMYHIQENSPCIDQGDPNYAADMGEIDIDGQPRIGAGRIDIGADEYYKSVLTADIYFDGIVNFHDFAVLADYWQSTEPLADIAPDGGDGVVDLLDLARMCEEWLQKEDWYQGP